MLATTPSRRPPTQPLLAATQGARLLRFGRAGAVWVLELEALVPVRERILRPMRHTLEGAASVTGWFQGRPDLRPLGAEVEAMIQRDDPLEHAPLGLEPREGRWTKVSPRPGVEPLRARSEKGDKGGNIVRDRLISVADGDDNNMRERALLRVTLDRITRRLGALEQRLDQFARSEDVAAQVQALRDAQDHITARVVKLEAAFESGVRAGPTVAAPPKDAPRNTHLDLAPAGPKGLRLPQTRDVSVCLKQLIGDRFTVHDWRKDVTDFNALKGPWYISTLIDDAGVVVGAMLGDLISTVNLGGGLMMLAPAELKEQLVAMEAGEETAAAYGEVFNTLSSLVNAVSGNTHVRTTYLEPFTPERFGWVLDPLHRLEMEDATGGRMVFVSKRP